MSVRQIAFPCTPLSSLTGIDGELLALQIRTEPNRLEALLELLCDLPYPVNPQIVHGLPTIVEFPVYRSWVEGTRELLLKNGIEREAVSERSGSY